MINLNNYRTGSKQVCISMSLDDFLWLKKAGYSPSRLMRKAIDDLRNSKSHDSLQEMYVKTEKQAQIIQDAMDFLAEQESSDKFFQFQEKKQQDALKIKQRKAVNKKETDAEIEKILGSETNGGL